MKERTLNQTWVLCLRMWRHISKIWVKDGLSVHWHKRVWLVENGFENADIKSSCFFCDRVPTDNFSCEKCPGKLVDYTFSCCRAEYNYEDKPAAFYKKLLRLNRIRKAKK